MGSDYVFDMAGESGKRRTEADCLWDWPWTCSDISTFSSQCEHYLVLIIFILTLSKGRMVELASNRVFEASDPVEAMAFDKKKYHLAVTSHHGSVAMYDIGRNGTMIELWSTKSNDNKKIGIPRSIQFYDGGKKVLVFMLETGEMYFPSVYDISNSSTDFHFF